MIRAVLTKLTLLADHEVVDVDGFVFKRKRRMPLSESANGLDEQAKRSKTCGNGKEKAGNHFQLRDQVKVWKKAHGSHPYALGERWLMNLSESLLESAVCQTQRLKAAIKLSRFVQEDGNSSPSQRAGDGCHGHTVEEAASHECAAVTSSIAQAALKALPSEGVSEGSRLMALCRKCVEVRFAGLQCTSVSVQVLSSLLPQSICHC